MSKLLQTLDQPDPLDPAHTALENSTVLFATEVTDGRNHTSSYTAQAWDVPGAPRDLYLPWFLVGGGAGYFRGEQVAYLPGTDHRDVLCTVADAMGVTLTEIGGKNVAPIEELRA